MLLSDEQRLAVDAGPIDLFITAGAGSGKTRVLTARFVHAVLGREPYTDAPPGSLLAVTFTERAAGELAQRIRGTLISEGAPDVSRRIDEAWISTIHGMCSKILRQHAFEAGLDPRFGVATDVEAGILAGESLEAVIRQAIEAGDRALQDLADALGFEALGSAIRGLHADAHSMGVSVTAIGSMAAEEVTEGLRRTATALDGVRERMLAPGDGGLATVANNIELLTIAATTARTLADSDPYGDREPVVLKRPRKVARHHEYDDAVEEALRLLEQVALYDAQQLVRPFEEAMLRALESYERTYARLKRERSLLDFEDLQTMVADLLDRHPRIAEEYRRRFRMVMIDEFQDTNRLQARIAERLSAGNMCTVGDEKQSIYSFRHADVEVFRERERELGHTTRLQDNYRSHPELLGFFNGLFGHEALFGPSLMRLRPGRDTWDDDGWPLGSQRASVVFVEKTDDCGLSLKQAEASAMAEEFARLRDVGVPQGDMVLLLRAMKGHAELFERELRARGFDVFIASGGTYFDAREIREVTALLRLTDNVRDDDAALTVLAGRMTGAGDAALYRLREAAGRHGCLWHAARRVAELEMSDGDRSVIDRTVKVVERMRSLRGAVPLRETLIDACERLDYDLALFADGPDGPRAWANVLKLARMADEFEDSTHGDVGLFLDYLASREEHSSAERQATIAGDGADAVRIMSIHAAKGLEFPVVGIASTSGAPSSCPRWMLGHLDDELRLGLQLVTTGEGGGAPAKFPTIAHQRLADQAAKADAEEIKRLLYVACTRAERALVLCLSDDLSTEATGTAPPALVRRALGLAETGAEASGVIELQGGGSVDVRVVHPVASAVDAHGPDPTMACTEPPALPPLPDVRASVSYRPPTVSYSGLSAFERCPRRYYAERVVGMPGKPAHAPVGTIDARSFGDAVHEAMRETWETARPDDRRIRSIAGSFGLGEEAVSRLMASLDALEASPLAARIRSAERVVAECPINTPVGGSVLVGSIDVIAWTGEHALIADYKTGRGELAEQAARERYRLQAECYALAALKAGAASAEVVFFEPERAGRMTTFSYHAGDAEAIEVRLTGILDAVERGEFESRESYEASACAECPAMGTLCPVSEGVAG